MLDVGCGVGQVVEALNQSGVHALGVDISHPNIDRALARGVTCQCYNGKRLPFEDGHFTAVGAFNVLEHVDDPSGFLDELVRVTRPGGVVVVSSPNFFRCIGFRDYHPRMRGWGNKWRNFLRLMQKRRQLKGPQSGWCFDKMKPIEREPFSPDDDAVVATNPMEISAFLEHAGCTIVSIACTDRPVAKWLDLCLNAGRGNTACSMGLWWRGSDRRRKDALGLWLRGLGMHRCGWPLASRTPHPDARLRQVSSGLAPGVSLGIPMRTSALMFATQSRRIRCGKNVMSLQK